MKKILITALAAGVVASSLGSVYAEGANKGEVKAGVIKTVETKDVANSKKKLVIGLIEGYDQENELVKIKPIFDLEGKVKGSGSVYISVKGAEFRDGKVTEYPEGYIISVYYEDLNKEGEDIIVDADFVSAVEENAEVTINDGFTTSGVTVIDEQKEYKVNPPKEVKEEKTAEKELVIGLIEGYDASTKKVKIKVILDFTGKLKEDKTVYIDLSNAEFPEKGVSEFPEGYIISAYYNEISESEDNIIVEADILSAVEENKEVKLDDPVDSEDIQKTTIETAKISSAKKIDEEKVAEKELVIGVIEGYDSTTKKAKVKVILDFTGKLEGDKTVYIDLSNAEFPEEGVREFPEGYLMSAYYNEISESEDNIIVKADVLSAVEENAEVSIEDNTVKTTMKNETVKAKEENELLIGKIEGYDSETKKVTVKTIFDLTGRMGENTVIIDLSSAEFPEDGVSEFPEGYLISVYYNEFSKTDDSIVVNAEVLSSVEEDGEVTIQDDSKIKEETNTVDVEVQDKKEDKGFFKAVADFFVNLFKF